MTLFERLYGDQEVPEGFDLMRELIRRVRWGEIMLTPTEESGWYDYQTWSLEPLILPDRMPEGAHLALGGRYRKQLDDLFRGALALGGATFMVGSATVSASASSPTPASSVLVVLSLRGGADGLSLVVPYDVPAAPLRRPAP